MTIEESAVTALHSLSAATALCICLAGVLAYPPAPCIVGGALTLTAWRLVKSIVRCDRNGTSTGTHESDKSDTGDADGSDEFYEASSDSHQHQPPEHHGNAGSETGKTETPWQLPAGIWSMVALLMLVPSGFLYGIGWLSGYLLQSVAL